MERPLDIDDVLYSGSDDDYYESPEERQRRCELQAQRYLDGKPVTILSAQLRGPFGRESGWLNPWRSRRQEEKETRPKPAKARHPTPGAISSLQPNGEHMVVPETIIKPMVPTPLQNTSSSNISLGPSSRKRETESSSFQLPSPVSTASHPRPINPWMDDEGWSRVQAWREAVKPEYGSGQELHIENKSLSSPFAGRKRPAAADFLRKALASSKRLKASELKYLTPATPSPVKRSRPIQQPDSSGTFGPVLPSSQNSNGADPSSSFREEAVNVSAVQEPPAVRAPLVDYASSYNTVPGQSPTLVLPHRTPTEPATPGLRQVGMQGEPTSPIRESPQPQSQPSFEQRLLSSRKVRASTTFRRSSTAPVETRQGTPLRSPAAHLPSSGLATPKYATQSSLPTSADRLVGTAIKHLGEQELEFESQADRSFQFRVKVPRNAGKRKAPKRNTERSRLNRVSRASTDDLVPNPSGSGPVRAGQGSGEAPVACGDADGTDHVSEDETASEGSLAHQPGLPEPEFRELTVQETGDVEKAKVLSAVEPILAAKDISQEKSVNVDVDDVQTSKILMEKSLDEGLMEDTGIADSVLAGPSADRSSPVPEAESEVPHEVATTSNLEIHNPDEDKPMAKLPPPSARILHQSTPLKVTPSNPASSPYVADLGGHHMLPALALSFSPLSSFFGTRRDDDPYSEVQMAEMVADEATEEVPEEGTENACEVRARSSPAVSRVAVEPRDAHATSSNGLSPGPVSSHPILELPQHLCGQPSSPTDSELRHRGQETSDGEGRPAEGPDGTRNDASDMRTDKRVQSSQHSGSPQPTAETQRSILESPHQQSPWTKDAITAVQSTSAVDGEQMEPEEKPQYNSTPANLDDPLCSAAHHHTHTPLDECDPSVATVVPSVQSPWVDTALTSRLPTARLTADVMFSSRQCHFPLVQPVQGSESQSQNPWRQDVNTTPAKMLVSSPTANQGISSSSPLEHLNHISHAHPHSFNQLSSPISSHGSTILRPKQLNTDEDLAVPDTTSPSAQHRPSTPSRPQSSLPTPDFTLSVKSFREFATPSPARRRVRLLGGQRIKSILKPTRIRYSDLAFPSRMTTKPPPKAKRVSFALELARSPSSSSFADESTTLGAELATLEATRTPPRRNAERSFSPPLHLSQSELPGSTDRFYSHFAKMVRKGPQMRRKSRSPIKTGRSKLLPSASQQILESPGFVDMAEAFIAADSMKLGPEDDDVDMDRPVGQEEEDHEVEIGRPKEPEEPEEEEYEDQYETDPVAHVLGNLDAFIGAFDVDLELSKARLVEDNAQESQSRQAYFPGIASQDLDREVTGRGVWS